ncbi:MAG TPA: hypothetical protein VI230_01855 [Ignavibacteriaceae bacterium]
MLKITIKFHPRFLLIKNLGDQTYGTGDEWPAGGIEAVPQDPLKGMAGWNIIGFYEYNTAVSGMKPHRLLLLSFLIFHRFF